MHPTESRVLLKEGKFHKFGKGVHKQFQFFHSTDNSILRLFIKNANNFSDICPNKCIYTQQE